MNRYQITAAGLWVAIVAACFTIPTEAPAVPVRLVGLCNGQLFAAMEESAFPAGCTLIEPIIKDAAQ